MPNLSRPLVNRHPLGKAIFARALFLTRQIDKSEQLFLEYLSDLPPDSAEGHRTTILVYNDIRILYHQKQNHERSEYYLLMTLQALLAYQDNYSQMKEETRMLFQIMEYGHGQSWFNSKLWKTCLYRVMQLTIIAPSKEDRKYGIINNCSRICYEHGYYR